MSNDTLPNIEYHTASQMEAQPLTESTTYQSIEELILECCRELRSLKYLVEQVAASARFIQCRRQSKAID